MRVARDLKHILWTILGYGALGSAVIIGDQIHKIHKKFEKATSTNVLSIDRIQPTYIYIEDPYVQEEIEAGVSLHNERLKLTRFHQWLYDKIEESFIFRNFYSYKKNLPWRFLNLTQDKNQNYRNRAIRSLASMKNLTDADCQQLAQACDLRTAIGLARSSNSEKFLLDPPYFKSRVHSITLTKNLRDFLFSLDKQSNHPCLQNFINKITYDLLDVDSKIFDEDLDRFSLYHKDFIPLCLEAILHHSWNDKNARQIIKSGGLPLLIEVYKHLKMSEQENHEGFITLTKIISNLSPYVELSEHFFMSGWLKILVVLSQNKDIRISAPARKALMNLDREDPLQKGVVFRRQIFPLHPTQRTLAIPKVDVVFIHGLLGEVFTTWRQRDSGHCTHKSPLELLATVRKLLELKVNYHLAFVPHLLASKKVPSFPIPESGLTRDETEERERMATYQTTKPLDQDFFVDVRDLNNWGKIAESYEFVLSDLPVDASTECKGPFYGSHKEKDCSESRFSKCWPKDWLAEDCPDIRLMGINYETYLSKWTSSCSITGHSGKLEERSQLLMSTLVSAGVGKRPIIWIGHSMGGLLVKGVLSLARRSSDPAVRSLLEQTRGIVFYSTPHKGSHLAALNSTSKMIVWPSVEVQELRENAPGLLRLHQEFLEIAKENPIKVITFAERESTYITALKFEIRFVDNSSADADVGESYGIPLDHLSICKPAGRQSFLYQKVKNFIQEIIKELEVKTENR